MKFAITTAVLGLATTISAIPVSLGSVIVPDNISRYHVSTGQIEYGVDTGEASKKQGSGKDISTLMTFYFGGPSQGKQCEFVFETDGPSPYTIEGSPQQPFIDVFFSSQIAKQSSPGWGAPSNYRDNQLGRLKPVSGGTATKEWGNFIFPCPAPGTYKGFEVVPTGDNMSVKWSKNDDGPYIRYF
jgi:hypothetical protein